MAAVVGAATITEGDSSLSLSLALSFFFVYLARPHAVSSLGEKKRARGCMNMMRKERGREGRVNCDHHEARENITEKEKLFVENKGCDIKGEVGSCTAD